MTQNEASDDQGGATANPPPLAALEKESASPPEQTEISKGDNKYAYDFARRFVVIPLANIVGWINRHDGAVGTRRIILFASRYDPRLQKFVRAATDDPDYKSAE